jgi:hypothetical protein
MQWNPKRVKTHGPHGLTLPIRNDRATGATAMHLFENLKPALELHKWALWNITAGFGALTVIYATRLIREKMETPRRASQIIASMCL